jgi:hypothetical protein
VIQLRHRQPSLWRSGLAKDIEDLWEPWMKEVDQLLEDAALADWLRRPYQRIEASSWIASLPVSRL